MKKETFEELKNTDYSPYGVSWLHKKQAIRFIELLTAKIPLRHIDVTDWTCNIVKIYITKPYGMSCKGNRNTRFRCYERFSLFDIKNCLKWWDYD